MTTYSARALADMKEPAKGVPKLLAGPTLKVRR